MSGKTERRINRRAREEARMAEKDLQEEERMAILMIEKRGFKMESNDELTVKVR